MSWAAWAFLCATFALLVVTVALSVMLAAERRRTTVLLDELANERDQWRDRADASSRQLQVLRSQVSKLVADASAASEPARPEPEPVAVITTLGDEPAEGRVVPDGVVLSATLGEPLVKAIALGHGLRRALSAESRNRIRFEVKRGTRAARKNRRRDMRQAWRDARVRTTDATQKETA